MAIPQVSLSPSDLALTLPDINAETQKFSPVQRAEQVTRNGIDPNKEYSKDTDGEKSGEINHQAGQLVERLNLRNSELSIGVDRATKKIVVKVLNSETKEVIRQIPPEEFIRMAQKLKELSGALLNEVV